MNLKNAYEFGMIGVICNENTKKLFEVLEIIKKLSRYAKELNRIAEDDCNGNPKQIFRGSMWITVQDEERAEKNEKRKEIIINNITSLLRGTGFTFETQGDPRGACLKVEFYEYDITNLLY